MSGERSPREEFESSCSNDHLQQEGEVFEWDPTVDVRVVPHLETDFWEIDLESREFSEIPCLDRNRRLSVTCNRLDVRNPSDLTPERRVDLHKWK